MKRFNDLNRNRQGCGMLCCTSGDAVSRIWGCCAAHLGMLCSISEDAVLHIGQREVKPWGKHQLSSCPKQLGGVGHRGAGGAGTGGAGEAWGLHPPPHAARWVSELVAMGGSCWASGRSGGATSPAEEFLQALGPPLTCPRRRSRRAGR